MSLGHGSNNQLKGAPEIQPRPPWRNVPQAAGEGLSSDGNTTSLAPIDDGQVLANTSGASDIPVGTNLTAYLDYVISSDQGTILFRNATEWVGLPPGTSGYFLETQGAAADIQWAAVTIPPPVTTTKGPPIADGLGNLDLALTDGNFPDPQILLNGSGNPIYISVPLGSGLSTTLTNTHIFVGNASNIATDVSVSGDATLANTGAITLASTGVSASTYGDATHVPQIAVDVKGRLTSATNVTITQPLAANPTATAGPAVINGSAATFLRSDGAPAIQLGSSSQKGLVQVDNTTITASSGVISAVNTGTVTTTGSPASGNLTKFSGSTSVTNGDLSGDVSTSGALITTLSSTGVSATTYGDATHVPQIAVDVKGRITSAANVVITQPVGANPTAIASDTAVNGTAPTFMRSDAAPAVQKTSATIFGLAKVDGTSITATAGVISATGNVVGPASATNNDLAQFDGTTGKLLKDGGLSSASFDAAGAAAAAVVTAEAYTDSRVALYLPLAGGTMAGAIKGADGAAATPSVYWDTNSGFWNDTTHTGIGISVGGTQVGWFAAGGPTYQRTGGSVIGMTAQGEAATTLTLLRYSADISSANTIQGKARGTIASPAVPVTSDLLGATNFQAWTGAAFTTSGQLRCTLTETSTVDATHIGSRFTFFLCPIGSGTLADVAHLENESGLSLFNNPVIDQNRVFRPRAYTVATVPAVTATGLIEVTDEGGGNCLAYCEGTNWRRTSDLQVLTASTPTGRGLLGRMTSRVAYVNQDIVQRTYSQLSAAGLLTKLLGLWVHAGAVTSQADALRNWITFGVRDLVIVGSPAWAQTTGFTGDGTTGLLNTNATIATFGASQNSFTAGCYVLTASAAAAAVIGQSVAAATRGNYMQSFTSGALTTRCMDGTNDSFTPTRYTGLFTMSRILSTGYNDSLDDLAATAVTRASAAFTARTIAFLGTNDTTANEYSTASIAFSFIGNGLTATDIANLRGIMVDYYLVQTGVVTNTIASLPAAGNFTGQTAYIPNLGGGAGLLQCDGINWFRTGFGGYEARTTSTGSETLTPLTNASNVEYTAILTGNLSVTLSGTDAKGTTVKKGAEFEITRSGLGLFTFSIVNGGGGGGTLATFASATAKAARCVFDGTNWRLMMDSNL